MSTFGRLISSAVLPFGVGRLAWSPDGQWLAAGAAADPREEPVVDCGVGAVEASSGIVRWLSEDRSSGSFFGPPQLTGGLAVSPDGHRVATITPLTASFALWRVLESSSGQEVWRVSDWGGPALFSPDNRRLAVNKQDPFSQLHAVLVDAATGQQLRDLGAYDSTTGAVFSSDWRSAAMLLQNHLTIVDTATGMPRWVAEWDAGTPAGLVSYSIQNDDEYVVVNDLQKVRTFQLDTGTVVNELNLEDGIPTIPELPAFVFTAFSPDSRRLVALSSDIRMFSLVDGHRRFTLPSGTPGNDPAILFSPAGAHFAAKHPVWEAYNARTGEHVWSDPTHAAWVVAFSPDGTRMAAGGPDPSGGRVQVYDTGLELSQCDTVGSVSRVAITTGGLKLVATVSGETASVFQAAPVFGAAHANPPLFERAHPGVVTSVLFSPDGEFFLTGSTTGARQFGTVSGGLAWKLDHGVVNAIAMSPAGDLVGTASNDKNVRVVRRDNGTELWKFQHPSAANHVAFSGDGARIATGAGRATRVFTADKGLAVGTALEQDAPVRALAFSPTRPVLATADDNGVVLMDSSTGLPGTVLPHPAAVAAVAFDKTGVLLATGGADRKVRIYNLEADHPVAAHTATYGSPITALEFIADTGGLAIVTEDGMVRIIDPGTGEERRRIIHSSVVSDVAVSASGEMIATACGTAARVYALV